MIKAFRRVTLLAQSMMAEVLSEGDSAIDATVGTGEDTCFLADCVGASGKVYGFDIQEAALKKANAKLAENKRLPQTTLFCMGHERMNEIFEINHDPKIKGIMFNLGYLPQGDSAIFTQSQTTLKALEQALCLIAP
ncbi:MAG: class I SAM-dependent methyltransferase, partial [Eubacterium sp.]